jgi:hypothetical protein
VQIFSFMRRSISHTGNDRYLYNVKLQQLKDVLRIVIIDLEHARIRVTLVKRKNELLFARFPL